MSILQAMQSVSISDLESHLSGYLESVKNGEEIIVQDESVPVARIVPFHQAPYLKGEALLVASGALKMPENPAPMDWDEFFSLPAGNVPYEVAVQAAIDGRGDR